MMNEGRSQKCFGLVVEKENKCQCWGRISVLIQQKNEINKKYPNGDYDPGIITNF